ncbi:MAG: amidohydrolase family protein [Planctomycetota bacterium]|nr:amidohydrolase family protein [Planctomycetota bacterium]
MNTQSKTMRNVIGLLGALALTLPGAAQVAVRGETIHTMNGAPIRDGVVVITDGKIVQVGPASQVRIPNGYQVLSAKVVTPGLVDAHSVVGLAGQFNYDHDQDQLESSDPIQPELRAIDAYNTRERLVEWVRSFGVTTIHTGHGPGELVSGQTIITKTIGNTVEDSTIVPFAMIACTLGESAQKEGGKSPGNRSKMMFMLRAELIKAREHRDKIANAEEGKAPDRDIGLESMIKVLDGEIPLMITAHRAVDINNALRLKAEFGIDIVLDGACEAYLLLDEIKASGVPVFVHPTMTRAYQETQNLSMENASLLRDAGIPFALQSGFESYVPKTRIVLFEAGVAAANGLSFEEALASITINAARLLGVDDRVGSIEIGKDGDLALYDGDPLEYTTHCIGTIIEGEVVSDVVR